MIRLGVACLAALLAVDAPSASGQDARSDAGRAPRFFMTRDGARVPVEANDVPALAARISLSLDNVTLEAALRTINRQAGLKLGWADRVLSRVARVRVNATDIATIDALNIVLRDANVDIVFTSPTQGAVVPQPEQPRASVAANVASFRGRVLSVATDAPVEGAEVVVDGGGGSTVTDAKGHFFLPNVPWQTHPVLIRKPGYRPLRVRITALANDTVDFDAQLAPALPDLDPIQVTASSVPAGLEDFAKRRAMGVGTFMDWNNLAKFETRRLSDVLPRIAGIRFELSSAGKLIAVSTRGRYWTQGECRLAFWVDGVPLYYTTSDPSIDDYPVSMIAAMEIYRGPAEIPLQMLGIGRRTVCGAIVIWTKP